MNASLPEYVIGLLLTVRPRIEKVGHAYSWVAMGVVDDRIGILSGGGERLSHRAPGGGEGSASGR